MPVRIVFSHTLSAMKRGVNNSCSQLYLHDIIICSYSDLVNEKFCEPRWDICISQSPQVFLTTRNGDNNTGSACSLEVSETVEQELVNIIRMQACCLGWKIGQIPRYLATLEVCKKSSLMWWLNLFGLPKCKKVVKNGVWRHLDPSIKKF